MSCGGKWLRGLRAYGADQRGNAAAELSLWFVFLTYPTLNVVDAGFYIFKTMQVREAAQAGAQTIESTCGYVGATPAASKCNPSTTPSLTLANLTTAVQSTSLGTDVTLGTGSSAPTEGWYCNNTSGTLVAATTTWAVGVTATAIAQPASCNATVTGDTDAPGDYVFVTVNYTYNPLFRSVSLISLLRSTSTITRTAWMRIN